MSTITKVDSSPREAEDVQNMEIRALALQAACTFYSVNNNPYYIDRQFHNMVFAAAREFEEYIIDG